MSCCTYDTVKYVHIKDARLGVLRVFFLFGIVAYVVVFEMMAQGGWLESSPVVGVVRLSLQHPTIDNCDPSTNGCANSFSALNTLPYCTQYNDTARTNRSYSGATYPCEIYEAINAQIVSERSIVVITRGSVKNQTLLCTSNDMTCPNTYHDTSSEHKFFTAQSEAFTILLDHAVTASKICTNQNNRASQACSSEASNYQGRLLSKSNRLCALEHTKGNAFTSYQSKKETGNVPCYIQPNRTSTNQDFFSLNILLEAAGMDLDDCNPNTGIPCQTYRDTGATLLLNIYWSDFRPFRGLVTPYYYYSPQFIVGSTFKQNIPFYETYRSSRTLLNAHGVKVAILIGGEFNQFNIVTFMVTLTTAVGLLAVATSIVDWCMLYILPDKKRYQQAKYEQHPEEFQATNILTSLNQLITGDYNGNTGDTGANEEEYETLSVDQRLNEPLL
jgi:ATP P2X receptor